MSSTPQDLGFHRVKGPGAVLKSVKRHGLRLLAASLYLRRDCTSSNATRNATFGFGCPLKETCEPINRHLTARTDSAQEIRREIIYSLFLEHGRSRILALLRPSTPNSSSIPLCSDCSSLRLPIFGLNDTYDHSSVRTGHPVRNYEVSMLLCYYT
jgi:hypothetical protein